LRRLGFSRLAVCEKGASALRQYAGMGDRHRTADGWAVEVAELSTMPERNDGERLAMPQRTGRHKRQGLGMRRGHRGA
jgi:hypothetical protein